LYGWEWFSSGITTGEGEEESKSVVERSRQMFVEKREGLKKGGGKGGREAKKVVISADDG
jgi:hypothetical protein